MKTFEFLHFDFKIYPYNPKDNNTSYIVIKFNNNIILEEPVKHYEKIFKVYFNQECAFQKHQLSIFSKNNHCELEVKDFLLMGGKFDNLEQEQLKSYKDNGIYTFEFESPYAYYFLKRFKLNF